MIVLPETQIEDTTNEKPKISFLDKLKIQKFKILIGFLGVLLFAGAFFAGYRFLRPKKVLRRYFNTSTGYEESNSYPITPTQKPTSTKTTLASPTPVTIEKIDYHPIASWQTYTDHEEKFSVQYPENYEVRYGENYPYGKMVTFLSCFQHAKTGERICTSGFSITVFDDYDGGSRRAYFNRKIPGALTFLTDPYFQDIYVAGSKALIIMDGNTGGSTDSFVLIPKGNKMYAFRFPFGWNPFTGDKSGLDFIKKLLSTFRFLK